ncbi:MAG: helix-turn-helix domain-containing protein [Eubacteriales bacterium]|nr:helix-turn-helix domain-containing protein [Eubacteriales bacterium]
MDIQKLTIGQMARLNHVTPETLRHYDREKLLHPWFIDESTGYRYYHINQSARLDMILYLQAHGVPLKQIRQHLKNTDPEALYGLLQNQLTSVEENIRRLEQSRNAIVRMIANHERRNNLPLNNTPFFEYFPSRRIYKHKTNKNFFEQDDAGYELMLRELKQSLVASNLPASYFWNVGTIVRKSCLEKGRLYSDEVFFFVEDSYKGPGDVETLPSGLHIRLCCNDFSKESECAYHLLDIIKKAGYTLAGDYVCEVVEEFPGFEAAPRSLLFTIQIPIRYIL